MQATLTHTIIVSRPIKPKRQKQKFFSIIHYLSCRATWDNWVITMVAIATMSVAAVSLVFMAVEEPVALRRERCTEQRRIENEDKDSECECSGEDE